MAENERNNIYNDDDRQYLEMMQGNIERMAANSANCKTWMVTIVAAVMALQYSISALNGWILLGNCPWYSSGIWMCITCIWSLECVTGRASL